MNFYLRPLKLRISTTPIWIGFRVKDTVQEGRNITEDVLMILRGGSNAPIIKVKSIMDQRAA